MTRSSSRWATRIGDYWLDPRSRTFAELLIDARREPGDPTEVRGRLIYGTPKTHAARTVTVPTFLGDELAHVMSPATDLVFATSVGTHLRVSHRKRRVFDRAASVAGLTPPSLRSTISETPRPR